MVIWRPETGWRIIIRRPTGWWVTLDNDVERYIAGPFAGERFALAWINAHGDYHFNKEEGGK